MIYPPKKAEQADKPSDTSTLLPTFDPTYVEGASENNLFTSNWF
jgi:hypothetical protein